MVSQDIKIAAEVEKIWILYDIDESSKLEYEEIKEYIQKMAYPKVELSDAQVKKTFRMIDTDGDGQIDKEEMKIDDWIKKVEIEE